MAVDVRTCIIHAYSYIHNFTDRLPDTVENGAISANVKKSIGNCDVMEIPLFLVRKIRVRNPHVFHHSLVQLQVAKIAQVCKIQAWIHPCLP
jgi:hypothetical protein